MFGILNSFFAAVLASGGHTWLPIYLQMPKIYLSQVLIVNRTKFLSLFDLEMQFLFLCMKIRQKSILNLA